MAQYHQVLQANVQHLVGLINQFLNFNSSKSDDKNHVRQIQNNLKTFSKQDNFFQISYQFILNRVGATYEQLFIASLLLRDKFRYQFDKYSDEQTIIELENMLKAIIKKHSEHPPDTFSTNICVCMICLYIKRAHQLHLQFKETGILEYFKSFVQDGGSPDYFYKALEYTPQQIYSSKIVMDQVNKQKIKKYIKASQFQVLKHLNTVAADLWQKKTIKKYHMFATLENWISLGFKQNLFQDLPNHFLVQKLFDYCLDPNVSTQAADCLKAIIKKLKVARKDDKLFSFLGNGVFQLVRSIDSSIKQMGDSIQINQAIEVVTDFGLLATQFFIENYNPDIRSFLLSTIQYIKIPDLDVYPNLIDFWECFINDIHKANALNNQFIQLLKNVYASVCYRTTWKFQMIQKMNQISEKNLGKFYNQAQNISQRRQESQDFFEVLALTFGQQTYLDFVLSCITQLNKNQPGIFWPYLESYLNSLKNAVKKITGVSESVKVLVSSYNQIQNYIAVKNAYMIVFKNLMTIQQPNKQIKSEFIKHLFSVIATNLLEPKLEDKAQKAFSKGCEQNPQIVMNYIEDFIGLLKQHQGNQQVVRGLMHVLNSNAQAMRKYLPRMLEVEYHIFNAASTSLQRKKAYYSLYAVFKILNNYKNKEHFINIVVEFTKSIWPLVLNHLREPKDILNDEDPEIQRAVKLVKFIMRCIRQNFEPFLQSLFTTIFQAYQKYPICSYIYTLEVAITVFYDNLRLSDYFKQLYKNFCHTTYAHLKQTNNIEDYQLLIDDFIGMNKRFFIYNSKIVLQSGQLPSLIETCINLCCLLDVPQVSKSAYQFFETIFMVYWSDDFINKYNQNQYGDKFEKNPQNLTLYSQLKYFIVPKLPQLITRMINHLQKVPLETTAECIMDALVSQIKAFPTQNPTIWVPILQKIPRQILTISQKTQLYQHLDKIGLHDMDQAREAASIIDRLIYIMNKRFINNYKRKI